ncbi:hypothetical protein MSIBF_A1790004 [groundwater metagenome]|uniref:Uncharacterized protein n=1 Tax=groundwater metagenome TaxID=717931 RepID=A0A098E7F5_9ZZZZ
MKASNVAKNAEKKLKSMDFRTASSVKFSIKICVLNTADKIKFARGIKINSKTNAPKIANIMISFSFI